MIKNVRIAYGLLDQFFGLISVPYSFQVLQPTGVTSFVCPVLLLNMLVFGESLTAHALPLPTRNRINLQIGLHLHFEYTTDNLVYIRMRATEHLIKMSVKALHTISRSRCPYHWSISQISVDVTGYWVIQEITTDGKRTGCRCRIHQFEKAILYFGGWKMTKTEESSEPLSEIWFLVRVCLSQQAVTLYFSIPQLTKMKNAAEPTYSRIKWGIAECAASSKSEKNVFMYGTLVKNCRHRFRIPSHICTYVAVVLFC